MLVKLQNVCRSDFKVLLFKAAFCLSFYGAFRIVELVARSKKDIHGGLCLEGVSWPGVV